MGMLMGVTAGYAYMCCAVYVCPCSNLTLVAWVIYYWVLFSQLKRQKWKYDEWDVDGPTANAQLESIMGWSSTYRCVAWHHQPCISYCQDCALDPARKVYVP